MVNIIKTFRPAYCVDHKPSRVVCLWFLLISGLFNLAAVGNTASAANYYVDTNNDNANDDNPGTTEALPWKTLAKAGNTAQAGDTVLVKAGIYYETLAPVNSGAPSAMITFKAYPGDECQGEYGGTKSNCQVVIDGENIRRKAVHLYPHSYIRVEGFEIRNHISDTIYISHYYNTDVIEGIEIVNNYIHDNSGWVIYARGGGGVPVENLLIENNEIFGNEESAIIMTVDGAVIRGNNIHYNGKDGIEGSGTNVLIENNILYNQFHTIKHQDGLDLDSLTNSIIRYNTIYDFTQLIYLSPADGDNNAVENVEIYGNILYTDKYYIVKGGESPGILIGGNAEKSSFMSNIDIHSNTFGWLGSGAVKIYSNVRGGGYCPATDIDIRNNIFIDADIGIVIADLAEISSDYNLFYTTPGSTDSATPWMNEGSNSITGQDPQFVDYRRHQSWDFHLKPTSPAIDAGDPSLATVFNLTAPFLDLDGNTRPQDSGYDIGAYEYQVLNPDTTAPSVPQNLTAQAVSESQIDLSWDASTDPESGVSYYRIYRDASQIDTSVSTSYSNIGLIAETTYTYEVSAVNGAALESARSNVAQATTLASTSNLPPDISAIPNTLTKQVGQTITTAEIELATDPEGDPLTYTYGWHTSFSLPYITTDNDGGTHTLHVDVSDGTNTTGKDIAITVNRPPVLTAIDNKSAYADVLLTFTIDATDPDGDPITYSSGTLPSGATFTGQTFDWTPSQSQEGSYAIPFFASDGQLQDSETITITVDIDNLAPTVTNLSPQADSIQVPLNNMITLHITDAGAGVDAATVTIEVNGNLVYTGDTAHYNSLYGDCRRTGTRAAYSFFYQSNETFDYDQTVTITVNATDLAGHVMNEYSYSFATEMRSFGQNKQVNSGLDNNDRPATVCDNSGSIWAAWHAGPIGNRDIYVSKLAAGEENFGDTVQLTGDATDQCNPAVALDSNDKLYVVWQDNGEGDWDIYVSTSVDGINWSSETMVHDPNDRHQVNPAIVIDSQNNAHVVWQDDREGNQDIFVSTSSDDFVTKTVSQITSDTFDQVEPAVAADSANTIYVVWTDERNSSNDIYGAASNTGPWTNVAIVNNANNQSSPTIAAEGAGSILHLLWVDDTSSDNDIHYATSNGLLDCPLIDNSIIDDTSAADQLEPSIVVTGSTGNDLKVFACWQDWRNADTDLYFAELSAGSGTNIFVGDGGSSAYQGEPVIGIDEYSHPYLVWADSRNTDIYYARSTYVEPVPLASKLVFASDGATVGTDPASINDIDDVSVVIPAGACSYDVEITISKINNPPSFAAPCLGGCDFGPSGIQFSQPVTITIPYAFSSSDGSATPYWFNLLSGTLSQQGITDVQDIVISPTLHALSFKTMHFTAFYLFGGGAAAGGGGGGGCSVSASGEGNIVEFILPYIGFVVVLAILTVRDARVRKARNMAAGKC